MSLRAASVMVDCSDPQTLARWYVDTFGGEVVHDMGAFVITKVDVLPLNLGFQQVPEPKQGKNRVHLDLLAEDRLAEVDRLVSRGATKAGDHAIGTFEWTVLQDPEGNELCIAQG